MPTQIIEATINENGFRGYFKWDENYNIYVLSEYTCTVDIYSIEDIQNALNSSIFNDVFYVFDGKICINKESADLLLKIGFENFKAIEPTQDINEIDYSQFFNFDELTSQPTTASLELFSNSNSTHEIASSANNSQNNSGIDNPSTNIFNNLEDFLLNNATLDANLPQINASKDVTNQNLNENNSTNTYDDPLDESDTSTLQKFMSKESDLSVYIPIPNILYSQFPLRFTYDTYTKGLVYIPATKDSNTTEIFQALENSFNITYKNKKLIFKLINRNILIEKISDVLPFIKNYKNAFKLISNISIEEMIRQGRLTITINLEHKPSRTIRKIIFKHDKNLSTYIFVNKEILERNENLSNLSQNIYQQILAKKFVTNPLTVLRNGNIKFENMDDITIALKCSGVSYTIDGLNNEHSNNNNINQAQANTQSFFSSIKNVMQENANTLQSHIIRPPTNTKPTSTSVNISTFTTLSNNNSNNDEAIIFSTDSQHKNIEKLNKTYEEESKRPGFNEFEQELRLILSSTRPIYRSIKGFYICLLNNEATALQNLFLTQATEKNRILHSLTGIHVYSIKDLTAYIDNIEKFITWCNNKNPYAQQPAKRQKTSHSSESPTDNSNYNRSNIEQTTKNPEDKNVDLRQKLITGEGYLEICLPPGVYLTARIPLRFIYDQASHALIYTPMKESFDINDLHLFLKTHFVANLKVNPFTLENGKLLIKKLDDALSLMKTNSILKFVANTDTLNNDAEIDKLIHEGRLKIIINMETQYTSNRKIIFEYDDTLSTYVAINNNDLLQPTESLTILRNKLYLNIFYKLDKNPLSVIRKIQKKDKTVVKEGGLKIVDINTVKTILNCNFVTYEIKPEKRNIQQFDNNSTPSHSNPQFFSSSQKQVGNLNTKPNIFNRTEPSSDVTNENSTQTENLQPMKK